LAIIALFSISKVAMADTFDGTYRGIAD